MVSGNAKRMRGSKIFQCHIEAIVKEMLWPDKYRLQQPDVAYAIKPAMFGKLPFMNG